LERVFEDDALAPGDGQVLLPRLTDDADLLLLKHFECQSEDVAVVFPEVVEEDWDLVGLPDLEDAPVVCGSGKLVAVVVVVPDLVFTERSVTHVTDSRCAQSSPIVCIQLQPLVSRYLLHQPLFEFVHVEQELVHDVLVGELHVRFVHEVVVNADQFPPEAERSVQLLLVDRLRASLPLDPLHDAVKSRRTPAMAYPAAS